MVCILQNLLCSAKNSKKTKTIWFLFLLNQIQSDQMVWILQNLLCSAKNSKRPKLCIWFLLNLWKNSNQVKTFFPHLLQNLLYSAKDQNNLISANPVKKQKKVKNFYSTPFAESILFMQTPISCYSANPVECQQCLKYSIIPQVLQNEIIGGAADKVNFSRFLQNLWNFS